jgi:inorganic pyrophosphatase
MKLPGAFARGKKRVNAIIETPAGSRNKFTYDKKLGLFRLSKFLPNGTAFPLAMGFIPGTIGEDGDPLDILVIANPPTYPGCLLECRVIGVIEAEQKEKSGKPVRNDRIFAVPDEAEDYDDLRTLKNMKKGYVKDVIRFFEFYNEAENKKFKSLGVRGPGHALKLINRHVK